MAINPALEFATADGTLFIELDAMAWKPEQQAWRAELLVKGGPIEAGARLIVYVQTSPWPHGSVVLLWRDERVRNLDIVGPSHKHPLTGKPVKTPHYQWLDAEGRKQVEAVDLDEVAVSCMEHAYRWVLDWCRISSGAAWVDPPANVRMLPRRTRSPRRRRQSQ